MSKKAKRLEAAMLRALEALSAAAPTRYSDPENSRSYLCAHDGCDRQAYAKGLCNAHYMRMRNGSDMDAPIQSRKRDWFCRVCGAPSNGKGGWGLCRKHYKMERRNAIKDAVIMALGGKCEKCGGQFPRQVFDLHHTGDKGADPSKAIDTWNVARLAEEFSSCKLLCANCHRMEHSDEYIF